MIKSILAVSEGGPDATMAFHLAGVLGQRFGAWVEAVHYPMGLAAVADGLVAGMSGAVIALDERRNEARAAASAAAFVAELSKRPECTFTKVDRQDLEDLLARARTTDLMVVGRPGIDGENPSPAPTSIALHESAAPVMVAPPSGALGELSDIVVAWNGSQQAARAVRFALPFLKSAKSVTVVVVGAGKEPVGTKRVSDWLGHHGVATTLASIDPGAVSARARGRALLAFTHGRGASMLVMGAYGQPTMLKMLGLGGATAKVVTGCRVPVLLAH